MPCRTIYLHWVVSKDILPCLSAFTTAKITSPMSCKPMTTATTEHRLTATYHSIKLSVCLTKGVYQDVTVAHALVNMFLYQHDQQPVIRSIKVPEQHWQKSGKQKIFVFLGHSCTIHAPQKKNKVQ